VSIYHCDSCEKPIQGTASDPVHRPGAKTLCSICVKTYAPTTVAHTTDHPDGRGAAARARWANMTPEAKAAHVQKMQAGRRPT
jgi:hypothetical protein